MLQLRCIFPFIKKIFIFYIFERDAILSVFSNEALCKNRAGITIDIIRYIFLKLMYLGSNIFC